ncbi:hypothetical protein HPB48_021931 [Haemaphysalis longicornis]|uniref:Uncharacterized protein n=1 Tax=Haemaphysalis longicornis TaxID=44386 RepID=A0A9J6GUA8_HAELO|nr:hypothetical protein HPB48_021931 [Haemaphysalis longicornis]
MEAARTTDTCPVTYIKFPPHAKALQERRTNFTLPGYKDYPDPQNALTAILLNRKQRATRHQFYRIDINPDLITTFPKKLEATKIFILNAYSRPRNHDHRFNIRLTLKRREVGSQAPLVVVDLNTPHTTWGYRQSNKKRTDLWEQKQLRHFSILTSSRTATRKANAIQVDTAPDRTFALHTRCVE